MRVLAVVAHADDEALGCGGALGRHAAAGDEVICLCLCACGLELGFVASCLELGAQPLVASGLADQRFDCVPLSSVADLVLAHTRSVWARVWPDIVYLHNPADLNLDHELAARATLTAFRPAGRRSPTLLAFETVSSTEWSPAPFAPDWFVPLDEAQLERKLAALSSYPTMLRDEPHPRNAAGVRAQAATRGAQAGCRYAEAYRLLRHTCPAAGPPVA